MARLSLTTRAALLTFGVALAAHVGNLANDFAWDDDYLIVGNPAVHGFEQAAAWFAQPWSAGSTLGSGREQNALYWRPLAQASYALDWVLGGGRPWTFHLTNDLLHALASVMVALLAAALARRADPQGSPRRPALAAALAGVAFAVHPVHSEAVNLATYRTTLLADLSVLAGLVLWARACLAPAGPGLRAGAGAAALLAVGVMSKESALMLPALLVLVEWALGAPLLSARALRRRAIPYLPVAAVAVLYLVVHARVTGPPKLDYFVAASRWEVWVTMLTVVTLYVRLMVFPWPLTSFYDWSIMPVRDDWTHPDALVGLALLALMVAGLVWALWRRASVPLVALGLWLGALLPYAHFLRFFDLCGERFLYLASAGPIVALGVWFARCLDTGAPLESARPAGGRLGRAMVVAVVLLFGVVSARRTAVFASSHTMLLDMVDGYPNSFNAHLGLARSFAERGEADEALRHGLEAHRILPDLDAPTLEVADFVGVARGGAARRAFLAGEVARRGLADGPLVEALAQ